MDARDTVQSVFAHCPDCLVGLQAVQKRSDRCTLCALLRVILCSHTLGTRVQRACFFYTHPTAAVGLHRAKVLRQQVASVTRTLEQIHRGQDHHRAGVSAYTLPNPGTSHV